jgi:chemotaxis protein methyltransferase CheR
MSMIEETQTFLLDVFGWKIEIHEPTFEAKLGRVCKELGFLELDSCVKSLKDLQKDAKTLQAFSREFSVGETYFFRDLKFFDYFKSVVIPQIVQKNERKLSVWSVGCGSGEELYSIAMILRESIPNIDEWNLFLLGTDVNPVLV